MCKMADCKEKLCSSRLERNYSPAGNVIFKGKLKRSEKKQRKPSVSHFPINLEYDHSS